MALGDCSGDSCGCRISVVRDSRGGGVMLVTTAEIAEYLGVQRNYTTNKIVRAPGFPEPKVNVSRRTRKWDFEEVKAWASQRRPAIDSAVSR